MHEGTKQRWLFERCPGIAPVSSKRLGVECWPNMNFLVFCRFAAALLSLLFFALACTKTDPGHDASRDRAESGWACRGAPREMGVKPFCFDHFCQETSTTLIPIACHDWPVGRGWVLYALFSVVLVSTFVPDLCCCLSPPKTLRRRGPLECGRTWPWRWRWWRSSWWGLHTPTGPHISPDKCVVTVAPNVLWGKLQIEDPDDRRQNSGEDGDTAPVGRKKSCYVWHAVG